MADNEPLFGVSAVSPQALALRRALLQKQIEAGMDTSPIRSPWQGAARIAQSVMGNLQMGMEERSEREARQKSKENLVEAYRTGNLAPALADPFITPEAMRGLLETKIPRQLDVGTGYTPTDPITGQPTGQTIPKANIGQISAPGGGSMPYVIPGQGGATYRPQAPAPMAGGSAPMPRARPPGANPPSFTDTATAPTQIGAAFNALNANPFTAMEQLGTFGQKMQAKGAQMGSNVDALKADMERASTAPGKLQQLAVIEDILRQYPQITGAAGEPVQRLKQAVNGVVGRDIMGETAPGEVLQKMNTSLAGEVARGMSSRGASNFDFNTWLSATPGGYQTSNKGGLALSSLLKQMYGQDLKLGTDVASQTSDYGNYLRSRRDWFDRNPLINPLNGKPMGVSQDTPAQNATTDREGYTIINGVRIKAGRPQGW